MYPYYGGPGGYPAMQTHSHGLGAPVGVPVHQMQPTSPVAPGIHYSQQFSSTSLTGSSGHFRRAGPGSSVLTSTGGALAGSGGPRASTGGALAGSGGPRAQSSFIIQQQQQQQHVQHPPGGHSQVPHGHVQTAHGAIQQSHTPAASKPSQQQSAYGVPVAHGSLGSKTENRLTGAVASVSPLATAMAAQSRQQVGETGGRRSPLSGTVGDADIARCRASLTLLKRKIKESRNGTRPSSPDRSAMQWRERDRDGIGTTGAGRSRERDGLRGAGEREGGRTDGFSTGHGRRLSGNASQQAPPWSADGGMMSGFDAPTPQLQLSGSRGQRGRRPLGGGGGGPSQGSSQMASLQKEKEKERETQRQAVGVGGRRRSREGDMGGEGVGGIGLGGASGRSAGKAAVSSFHADVGHQRVGTGTSGSPLERDGRERGGEDFSFSESKGNTFGTTAGGGTGRPRLGKSGTATSSSGVVGGVGGGRGRGRGRQTGGGSRAFSGDVGDVSASSSSFHMQQQRRERERETRGSVGTEGSVNPDERAAVASGIPNAPLLDDVDEGDLGPKQECPDCGRLFNSSAFAKHRNVCKKVFVQKRRRFDSMKRRIADIDGAQDMMRRKEVEERAERRGGARGAAAALHRSSENTAVGGKQNNNKGNAWRLKSQAFRAAIAAARGDSSPAAAEQAAQAQAQLEALGPDPNTSACPHCGRRMNDTAAAKHVPICQKVFGNKGGRLAKGTGQGLGVAARGAGRTSEGRGSNGAARVKRRS